MPGGPQRGLERLWWRARPCALGWLLWPLSWLYRALAGLSRARVTPQHVGVPVLVVGNLVVGGAGKTPTVLALLRLLRAQGWTPGVVSRGYGRLGEDVLELGPQHAAREAGDEPMLILRRGGGAPVVVGRDRVAAARALRHAHPEVDLIVADDGLQHHRLARDAQVLVFDERGAGNGLCLPAGPLREPLPAQVPPRSLVLYNAAAPSTPLPGWLALRRLAPPLPLAAWQRGDGAAAAASDGWVAWRGRRVLAVAGIASPVRFFSMLRELGLEVDECPLPDHHAFDALPWPDDPALDVMLTEKDAVKLAAQGSRQARVWVAPLDFEPEAAFAAALSKLLPR